MSCFKGGGFWLNPFICRSDNFDRNIKALNINFGFRKDRSLVWEKGCLLWGKSVNFS